MVCSRNLDAIKAPPGGFDDVAVIRTEDTRKALAQLSANFYRHPAEEMKVIGVTGTKGKTTTAFMIQSILNEAGYKTGLIGTVHTDNGKEIKESEHTTPESADVQRILREMADNGCDAAVIEVSSQALKLARVEGICFDLGVFTNIEEDHIGPFEHEDFEDYARCKAKLFQQCRVGIINNDDPCKDLILENHTCMTETYGFGRQSDLQGINFSKIRKSQKLGVEFTVKGDYNNKLVISLPGKFTCSNALAAISAAKHFENVSWNHIRRALKDIRIPGRQEMFSLGEHDGVIIVDYAHNGMALENMLKALKEYEPDRLICVFGCGGDRDRQRRFRMGKASAEYADFTVITSDNPRNESPMAIIRDIIEGMKNSTTDYTIIPDRKEAIEFAVKNCGKGDIVLIAGKGHENHQITGDKKIHFDDRETVLASIEKVKHERDYISRN